MEFVMKFGTAVIAAAILWGAMRLHKIEGGGASGKPRGWLKKHAKSIATILAFVAGLAMLVTVVGSWMLRLGHAIGPFAIAGLIVVLAILAIDWGIDGEPNKPAFWSAFVLAFVVVLGLSGLPSVGDQISDGAHRVGSQMTSTFHDAKGR